MPQMARSRCQYPCRVHAGREAQGGSKKWTFHVHRPVVRHVYICEGGSTVGAMACVFLRTDLGFESDEKLTLRHLAMPVSVGQYQTLLEGYTALLKQRVEVNVP
jgi:hypothetical protein